MESSPKPNMVLGYNHNIKHKGNVYHVQTEDSGTQNPHIITHLFVGGNIIATKKTSYADIVHAENLEEIVRELMQEQHKAMLRNLINGVYDAVDVKAERKPGQTPSRVSPGIKPAAKPQAEPTPMNANQPGLQPSKAAKPALTKFPPAHTQTAKPPGVAAVRTALSPEARKFGPAASGASKVDSGGKSAVMDLKSSQPGKRAGEKPGLKDTAGPTIFGEDLITEKSLDEVILGYLSGDSDDEI